MKRLPVILLALAGLALCFQQLFSRHVVHAEMQSLLISDEPPGHGHAVRTVAEWGRR